MKDLLARDPKVELKPLSARNKIFGLRTDAASYVVNNSSAHLARSGRWQTSTALLFASERGFIGTFSYSLVNIFLENIPR